jgi:hypothetical protein
MERKSVFCEIGFYTKFIDLYPTTFTTDEDVLKKSRYWIDFYSFITRSNLFFNISKFEFDSLKKENELLEKLWKRSTGGMMGLEFWENNFPNIINLNKTFANDNKLLESIFLSCEKEDKCKCIGDKYGIKIISINSIQNYPCDNLFDILIKSILKNSKHHFGWDFLSKLKHPCNTLTIVDNYILKEEVSIKENLIPLIETFLPANLEIPFHISIFAKKMIPKKNAVTNVTTLEPIDFQNRINLITSLIKEKRPNLDIKIGLFEIGNELHDRSLMTNYLYLESGSGFDLFKNRKANHQTKIIGFYPFAISNINDGARILNNDLRNTLKTIYKNAVIDADNQKANYFCGDKENRLLD